MSTFFQKWRNFIHLEECWYSLINICKCSANEIPLFRYSSISIQLVNLTEFHLLNKIIEPSREPRRTILLQNFLTRLFNNFLPSFSKKEGKKSLIKNYQSHPRYLNFSCIIDTIEATNYWQKKKKKLANNKWQFPFLPSSIISRRQPTPRQCPMKTKKMNGGGKRRREREGDLNGCCSFFGGRRLADLIHEVADTRSKGIRSRLETCLPSWAGMAWVSAGYSFEHPLPRNPVKFMIDCHERRLWVEPFRATEFFVNWTNIVSPPPPPPPPFSLCGEFHRRPIFRSRTELLHAKNVFERGYVSRDNPPFVEESTLMKIVENGNFYVVFFFFFFFWSVTIGDGIDFLAFEFLLVVVLGTRSIEIEFLY